MKDLFTIGEMHKLFAVPVRTLRFYDEIGLLRPERVDPRTGYRYYSAGQFERLNTIKYLRALGVSLERIRGFFENRDTDVVELLLQEQLADTRRRLDELQRIERRIGRRLDDLRRARTAKTGVVLQKALPARAIAFLRQEIPQGGDLETPLAELQSHIRQDAVNRARATVRAAVRPLHGDIPVRRAGGAVRRSRTPPACGRMVDRVLPRHACAQRALL